MKGHKFDWRVKRPPPFCLFVTGHAGLYDAKLTCEARMQRNRAHRPFEAGHRGIVFIGQIEVDDAMQFHRQPRR